MSRIAWANDNLEKTKSAINLFKEKSIPGSKILICSHLEAKLIAFANMLHEAGFEVHLISNLPSSIKKELLPEILQMGLHFYDTSFLTFDESEALIAEILNKMEFDFVFDDGGHTYTKLLKPVRTIFTEFTQSGINSAITSEIKAPVINLNSSFAKRVVGNIYGTGISTLAAIQTLTNINFYGLNVGIMGLGPIGLSCALAFKGIGANVLTFDIDPAKEFRANKNGISFKTREELLMTSDLIITCTGQKHVISGPDLKLIKNGAILCNVGHFNQEIEISNRHGKQVAPNITKYNSSEKSFYLLANGNLVNLATGMGYPIQIIDISFAAAIHGWINFQNKADIGLIDYPEHLDRLYFKTEMDRFKDLT
jgi:adenosylhomocysteinase